MVLAAVLNVSASFMNSGGGSASVEFFHGFQVALMMTVMLNLAQFVWWRCKQSRRGTLWNKYQPVFWTLLSAIMVNIQPMWILVIASWKFCCATCDQLGMGPDKCPASGFSFPPFGDGEPRPCEGPGGNVFWDVSHCGGQKLATFPDVAAGWAIQVLLTWGGFVFMFIGILQATQLHKKVARTWRDVRNAQVRTA